MSTPPSLDAALSAERVYATCCRERAHECWVTRRGRVVVVDASSVLAHLRVGFVRFRQRASRRRLCRAGALGGRRQARINRMPHAETPSGGTPSQTGNDATKQGSTGSLIFDGEEEEGATHSAETVREGGSDRR